jgi:two-component system chemotaxis response regulator CheB
MSALRIVVVDDAALYRKILRDVLATVPDVDVVGVASNGRMALEAIQSLRPDLITLDIEMPELDGLGVLNEIKRRQLPVGVIMLSSLTVPGAEITIKALRAGAFDFLPKPSTSNPQRSLQELHDHLAPKIDAFRKSRSPAPRIRLPASPRAIRQPVADVVAIGVSTGGPSALAQVLPKLPTDFPIPIVIVQHMPPIFTKSLASDLNRICALEVVEAADGDILQAGQIYIAPGGQQMRLQRATPGPIVRITDDPPEKSCKPSVDYLFRSVSEVFGRRALAVVLTGMGDDGMLGCQAIKSQGGIVLAQDQTSCVVFGMPRAVIDSGYVDMVTPLSALPSQLIRLAAVPALSER